jgi:hypothetical protein
MMLRSAWHAKLHFALQALIHRLLPTEMVAHVVVLQSMHPGHTFVPASVETYGHLGRPIMRYLRTLSDIASARSLAVTRGSFLASAHRELSVALDSFPQSQGYVYCSYALLLAKASGRPVLPGAEALYLD